MTAPRAPSAPPFDWRTIVGDGLVDEYGLEHAIDGELRIPPDDWARYGGIDRAAHFARLTSRVAAVGHETLSASARAAGVDVTFPFLDPRVVASAYAVPFDAKARNGWSRRLLRDGLAGGLPPSVRWRTDKTDFAPLLAEGLRLDRGLIEGAVFDPAVAEWVRHDGVRQLVTRVYASEERFSVQAAFALLRVASLAAWMKSEGRTPPTRIDGWSPVALDGTQV